MTERDEEGVKLKNRGTNPKMAEEEEHWELEGEKRMGTESA